MSRLTKHIRCCALVALLMVVSNQAWAYIDPNVPQTVFYGITVTILIGIGVVLNILFWPILFLRKRIMAGYRKLPKAWKVVVVSVAGLLIIAVALFICMLFNLI